MAVARLLAVFRQANRLLLLLGLHTICVFQQRLWRGCLRCIGVLLLLFELADRPHPWMKAALKLLNVYRHVQGVCSCLDCAYCPSLKRRPWCGCKAGTGVHRGCCCLC